MKVLVTWTVQFREEVEAPSDFDVADDGLDNILTISEMSFNHPSGELVDWSVQA